jgi:hypothetical protein
MEQARPIAGGDFARGERNEVFCLLSHKMHVVSSILGFQQREQGDSDADLKAFLSTHSRGLCPSISIPFATA